MITIEVDVELPPIDATVILNRCEKVSAWPVRVLYVSSDAIDGGLAFFSYHCVSGGFADDRPREEGYSSRQAQSSYFSLYPRMHAYRDPVIGQPATRSGNFPEFDSSQGPPTNRPRRSFGMTHRNVVGLADSI